MSINSHANRDDRGNSRRPGPPTARPSRRAALRLALLAPGWPAIARGSPDAFPTRVRAFRLIEADGLRRDTYPIHTTIEGAGRDTRFLLLRDGQPIVAQFRPIDGPNHDVALDFEASLDSRDTRRYEVHSGQGVDPGPDPGAGIRLERVGDHFQVTQPTGMAFRLGRDLFDGPGPLVEAGSPRLAFVGAAGTSVGVEVGRDKAPIDLRSGRPPRVEITRQGPLAVVARVEAGPFEGGNGSATLDLTFPRGKPWVEAVLTLDDPRKVVTGLQFALGLAFDPDPSRTSPAGDWARVDDAHRSVIAAAAGGGNVAVERKQIVIRRDFEPSQASKSLTFRVLFGSRSGPLGRISPDAMIHPPRVEWDRPRAEP